MNGFLNDLFRLESSQKTKKHLTLLKDPFANTATYGRSRVLFGGFKKTAAHTVFVEGLERKQKLKEPDFAFKGVIFISLTFLFGIIPHFLASKNPAESLKLPNFLGLPTENPASQQPAEVFRPSIFFLEGFCCLMFLVLPRKNPATQPASLA